MITEAKAFFHSWETIFVDEVRVQKEMRNDTLGDATPFSKSAYTVQQFKSGKHKTNLTYLHTFQAFNLYFKEIVQTDLSSQYLRG